MLRPATPLSLIFLAAFVLSLLSTLSTPIIKAIPLGRYEGYTFGVFGWCNATDCSPFEIGYDTDPLFNGGADPFTLSDSARHSISGILIVHPVAALLILICFGLAVAAHFHGPSHSPRYLLGLLILTIPTLIVTLLAFLVDILLFVPHLQWGGWIELAATILIIGSTIVTCAMRRTVVSRKARKQRIAENADMNGTNYYENLASQPRIMTEPLARADSPPPMTGTTVAEKGVASSATFDMRRQDTRSQDGGRSSQDDRTPLNRDPSFHSAHSGKPYGSGDEQMPGGQSGWDNGVGPRRPSRDQYGNPIEPGMAMGMNGGPGLRHQGSQGSLGSHRMDGPPRGRGGYGPPPRGYGPPRGGYGGPPRGGYGPRGGPGYGPRGGYRGGPGGPPPPGWNGRGRGGYGPPPSMMGRGGPAPRAPPPGYVDPYYYSSAAAGSDQSTPGLDNDHYSGAGGAIGQAIEMDERHVNSRPADDYSQAPPPLNREDSYGNAVPYPNHHLHPSNQPGGGGSNNTSNRSSDEARSPTSVYSAGHSAAPTPQPQGGYVPAREGWNNSSTAGETPYQLPGPSPSPTYQQQPTHPHAQVPPSLSPIQASPQTPAPASGTHRRDHSENYVEDIDPRFAHPENDIREEPIGSTAPSGLGLPPALRPGASGPYGSRT